MRRLLWASIVASLLGVSLNAVSYIGWEQITVDNTAGGKGFTAAKITPPGRDMATQAVCRNQDAQIRYTIDQTAPTTTVGTQLEAGDILTINGHDLMVNFRAIRTGSTSGVLNCNYTAN